MVETRAAATPATNATIRMCPSPGPPGREQDNRKVWSAPSTTLAGHGHDQRSVFRLTTFTGRDDRVSEALCRCRLRGPHASSTKGMTALGAENHRTPRSLPLSGRHGDPKTRV